MTRRTFLGFAAGAVTTGLHGLPGTGIHVRRPIVVLHLSQDACESVAGYTGTLSNSGTRFLHAEPLSVPRCAVLIVPAALRIRPALRAIVTCLADGATVILESGACFAGGPAFRAHRAELRDCLQVQVDAPVRLWSPGSGRQGIPYVDYSWPRSAKIRDFSRALPLARQPGEIIARVDGLPVCLKRRMGRGTLIFLGSPLGPALWAGDAEARQWLLASLPLFHQQPLCKIEAFLRLAQLAPQLADVISEVCEPLLVVATASVGASFLQAPAGVPPHAPRPYSEPERE